MTEQTTAAEARRLLAQARALVSEMFPADAVYTADRAGRVCALKSALAAIDAHLSKPAEAPQAAAQPVSIPQAMLDALRFYANRDHMALADESAWDTVSGEPPNFWCDEAGTATIEDGAIAAMALRGVAVDWTADDGAPPAPIEGEVSMVANATAQELREAVRAAIEATKDAMRPWAGFGARNGAAEAEAKVWTMFDRLAATPPAGERSTLAEPNPLAFLIAGDTRKALAAATALDNQVAEIANGRRKAGNLSLESLAIVLSFVRERAAPPAAQAKEPKT